MQMREPSGLLAQITRPISYFHVDFVMDAGALHPDLPFRTEILSSPLLEVLAAKGPHLSPAHKLSGWRLLPYPETSPVLWVQGTGRGGGRAGAGAHDVQCLCFKVGQLCVTPGLAVGETQTFCLFGTDITVQLLPLPEPPFCPPQY